MKKLSKLTMTEIGYAWVPCARRLFFLADRSIKRRLALVFVNIFWGVSYIYLYLDSR